LFLTITELQVPTRATACAEFTARNAFGKNNLRPRTEAIFPSVTKSDVLYAEKRLRWQEDRFMASIII
jgi:hypothetical protein